MKLIMFVCMMTLFTAVMPSNAAVIGPARVLTTDGDVVYRTAESGDWQNAFVNAPLDEGDTVWVPADGKAELQLANGTVIRLDGGSQIDFLAVEDGFTHLHLESGRLYVKTAVTAGKNALQIDADDTAVLPDSRTRLRIDMLPNSQEDVTIFKGAAYVEGNGNRTKVRAGEHIALEEGHSELLPLNPADSWEKWNSNRDRSQAKNSSQSDLPEELQSYTGELDSHGKWVSVPEYGMVWYPTVIGSDDWAPYRSGRWIWKSDDYVWISYETWGWAPYHYGRWTVVNGFGWCWIPPSRGDVYWGPGYVGWYRSGTHVGWTPLAPGETYYGHRHYGKQSVNVTSSSANTASITYRNRNVRGGLNLVLQSDFSRGRTEVHTAAAPSVAISASFGSPRIKPVRDVQIKQNSPRVAAPAVQPRTTNELRSRYPRVMPASERHKQALPTAATPAHIGKHDSQNFPKPSVQQQPQQPHEVIKQKGRSESATGNEATGAKLKSGDSGGQRNKQKEIKQKKVWKIITVDQNGETPKKGREHKGER